MAYPPTVGIKLLTLEVDSDADTLPNPGIFVEADTAPDNPVDELYPTMPCATPPPLMGNLAVPNADSDDLVPNPPRDPLMLPMPSPPADPLIAPDIEPVKLFRPLDIESEPPILDAPEVFRADARAKTVRF